MRLLHEVMEPRLPSCGWEGQEESWGGKGGAGAGQGSHSLFFFSKKVQNWVLSRH